MPRTAVQKHRDELLKKVELLEKTLADTERILFDGLVELSLKHYGEVRREHAKGCNEVLRDRAVLRDARNKRVGPAKSWRPPPR